jgi:hypothetical protein
VGNCQFLNESMPIEDEFDYFFVGHALHDKCLKDNNYLDQFNRQKSEIMLLEIHSRESREERYPGYVDWLKGIRVSKYMQEYHPDLVFSYKYPKAEIEDYLSFKDMGVSLDYFMSSFAYMVAWGIYKGYRKIMLYGINMVFSDDYIQKYNFEFWLGMALGRGIGLQLTKECDLLKCKSYGYEVDNTLGVYMQRAIKGTQLNILKDLNFIRQIIGNLEELAKKIDGDLIDLLDNRLDNIDNAISSLYIENPKFMEQILDRHGLDIEPQVFDLGDKD